MVGKRTSWRRSGGTWDELELGGVHEECDEGATNFAAQLPDEDEFLGMTSEGPTGEDSWGYFDEKGNWVSLEGDASAVSGDAGHGEMIHGRKRR